MLIDEFSSFENKYLFEKKYDDFSYWVYSRYAIFSYLTKLQEGIEMSSQKMTDGLICGIKNMIINSLRYRHKIKKIGHRDLLILNHERRVLKDGYYRCIYTEQIEEHYPNSVVLERPYFYKHLKPIQTERIFYSDCVELESLIYGFLECKLKAKKYRKAKKFFEKEMSIVAPEFQHMVKQEVSVEALSEMLTRLYLLYCVKRKKFEKIIQKIQPKVILEVVSYNLDCMIFNEIAYEKKINTIELQHGVMSGSIAYYYPKNVLIKQSPQKVFLFSDYWKNCISVPLEDKNVISVGYPYFEEQVKKYQKINCDKNKTTKVILFLSQWTIGENFSKFAVEFNNLINGKWKIIYKLHPGEYANWKKRYPWLVNSGIEVVDSLRHNIYEYFAVSNVQVGVSSTAIFEGLGFGLDTFIFNTVSAECMKQLCQDGFAAEVNSAKELADKLEKNIKSKKNKDKLFWKENAFNNLCVEINKCIDSTTACS